MGWWSVCKHVDAELVLVGMKTELNVKSKTLDLLVTQTSSIAFQLAKER